MSASRHKRLDLCKLTSCRDCHERLLLLQPLLPFSPGFRLILVTLPDCIPDDLFVLEVLGRPRFVFGVFVRSPHL